MQLFLSIFFLIEIIKIDVVEMTTLIVSLLF